MPKEAMNGISFELFGMITVRKCLELHAVPIVRIAIYVQEVNRRTSKVNGDKEFIRSFKTLHGFVRRKISHCGCKQFNHRDFAMYMLSYY